MSSIKLKTEISNSYPYVYVTGCNHQLVTEVLSQLSELHNINVLHTSDLPPTLNIETPSTILHFVGFGAPSLSQTISATETLHRLLQLAYTHKSKLLLILGNSSSHLCNTAVSLLVQFAKIHNLRYDIVQYDPTLPYPNMAEAIIGKFVYRYSYIPRPRQITIKPLKPSSSHVFKKQPYLKNIFLVLVSLAILFIVNTLLYISSFKCSVSSFVQEDYLTTVRCLNYAKLMLVPLRVSTRLIPGSGLFFEKMGYSFKLSSEIIPAFTEVGEKLNNQSQLTGVTDSSFIDPELSPKLANLKATLTTYSQSVISPGSDMIMFANKINQLQLLVGKLDSITPIYKILRGYPKAINYLIVTQANTSLSPTGGVLKTLQLTTVDQGKESNSQIFNAGTLTLQIPGKFEPTPDLRRLYGINNLTLMQSNWSPDISQSANKIAWFVEKGTGVLADVVVILPENSLNGSEIIELFIQTNKLSRLNMLIKLAQLLENRQIFIVPILPALKPMSNLNWSGEIKPATCRSQLPCQNDAIYLADTNIKNDGIDKYIERLNETQISITSHDITTLMRYSQKLLAPSLSTADNFTYRRIYLPDRAKIIQAKIDGKSILNGLFPVDSAPGMICWGFKTVVASGKPSLLEITYTQSLKLSDSYFHYQLDIPNQPGLENSQSIIEINYPNTWFATTYEQPTVATPGTLRYNTQSSMYQKVNIDFLKKIND